MWILDNKHIYIFVEMINIWYDFSEMEYTLNPNFAVVTNLQGTAQDQIKAQILPVKWCLSQLDFELLCEKMF